MKAFLVGMALFAATPAYAEISLTVDRSERTITIRQDGRVVNRHSVAVGKPGDETPLGSWTIREVHMNPDWVSTRNGRYYPSGPTVPLGRVRLRYNMPYALHGTINPASIGTAASLGCIRMQNEEIIELARLILQDSGNYEGDSWFQYMLARPTRQYQIRLNSPVQIRVVE